MEKRLGAAWAVNDDGGAAGARRLRLRVLWTAKEERESETEGAGGCWRDNAVLRRVVAGVVRALATRGHGDLHAARGV